jgi:hypothetical protein
MRNERNFKKNPHTARWLMTFHTAGGTNLGTPEAEEERAAMQFLTGDTAPQAESQGGKNEIFIQGWRILTGPGLITEPQAKWIVDIAETRDGVTDEMVKSLAERLIQGFSRSAASQFISQYKDLPRRQIVTAEMAEAIAPGASTEEISKPIRDAQGVKAGRYALVVDGVTKFYRVTEGKGRWAGRTFVEAQASDDHWAIKNPEARAAILKAIAENPLEAERRYGQELGRCSRCGRTLTDETSRAYGIGPECRKK